MSDGNAREAAALVILRWTARLSSIASVGLILLFFVGEGIDPAVVQAKEWVGLLFFPAGVVVGMLVAWRNEGLGGSIVLVSLLGFYVVYGYLLSGSWPQGWAFLVLSAPGLLFLLYALIACCRRH